MYGPKQFLDYCCCLQQLKHSNRAGKNVYFVTRAYNEVTVSPVSLMKCNHKQTLYLPTVFLTPTPIPLGLTTIEILQTMCIIQKCVPSHSGRILVSDECLISNHKYDCSPSIAHFPTCTAIIYFDLKYLVTALLECFAKAEEMLEKQKRHFY